ncbi:hypothetical protein B0J13DRAFT_98179 [Dactylonectria estremocensis]|uniref:Uncharacterized protein n=1 Tax=Dactylonectria estremocensis TaxID=1079267 RepID=A0A9P9E6E4_9HYPO|nr:hypothetical protein B0J13DRAFT_98179 [Dactylonectria estremocensis]
MRSWQVLPALVGLTTAACYYSDGVQTSTSYFTCGSSITEWNTCCFNGETCLENGLCQETTGAIYRGPCDNANWEGCYQVCVDPDASYNYVDECSTGNYCCLESISGSCCSNSTAEKFTVADSPDSTASASASVSGTATLSSTAGTVTITASRSASASSKPDNDGPPVGAIAGGVVGGVVLLAVIGGLIWFLLRKKKNPKPGPPGPPGSQPPPVGQVPPQGYGQPPQQFGQTPQAYAAVPGQYSGTPSQYGQPPSQYGQTPSPYGQSPLPYGQAPQPYGTPQPYNNAPAPYGSPPPQFSTPPQFNNPTGAPMGNGMDNNGMGVGMMAAGHSPSPSDKRQSHVAENTTHDGGYKNASAIEIDDGVHMQPPVEIDSQVPGSGNQHQHQGQRYEL